ncbi:MAG: hypothetical protein CSA49_05635 [Gammaproteobacteria bacterium]|nr:MAG: hypothetical protein CSA49_05635 [Gammaproteobacteria bacterium]
MTSNPLKILIISDGKPGHENQSMGLAQAINRHREALITKVAPNPHAQSIACLLFNKTPDAWQSIDPPDLCIATGSGTQFSLIAAKHYFGAYSVVLSGPSFPGHFFDLCVIPEHDGRTPKSNLIFTQGVLNKITPSEQGNPEKGLILIGGESKHYQWDSIKIAKQIQHIVSSGPQIKWQATNSRRTPEDLSLDINHSQVEFNFTPWQDTSPDWLPQQIAQAGQIWVTPDSVSMVYESLTSGNNVFLFDLPPLHTKVCNSIEKLRFSLTGGIRNGAICPPGNQTILWEADRVATAVLEKLASREQAGK